VIYYKKWALLIFILNIEREIKMLTRLKFNWYCANEDWYLDYRAKNTPWYWARKSPVGYYPLLTERK
jgi:hypothetical protein